MIAHGSSVRSSASRRQGAFTTDIEHQSPEQTDASRLTALLILDNLDCLVEYCQREMVNHTELTGVVEQLRIAHSEEWVREAISLFSMCMDNCWSAVEWHDEVGELNFTAGLSIAAANEFLSIVRDGILQLVWTASSNGVIAAYQLPEVVATVLRAFDRALAAQASAYVRESQRHLNEVNERLEYRTRQFERDLALATLVQQKFIPKNLRSENFSAEVRYVPTTGIGGDHAGIFPVSPERLYVTISDVTGHGIASALVTEAIRSQLRPLLRRQMDTAFQYSIEPVDVVRELNEQFFREFQSLGMLLTFFIAMVDSNEGTLTYSGAGHPPPILQCCRAHNMIELRSQNIILGAAEDCILDSGQDTIDIHRGDRIIFYTDGIIEANSDGKDMLGLDGLKKIIEKHYETPPVKLADEILTVARETYGDNETDDMSLVLLDILKRPEAR